MEWIETAPGTSEIAPDDVHIWRFPVADPAVANAVENLTTDELARAGRMGSHRARRSFVTSQAAVREVLSAYTRTPPLQLEFARGPHGKPMLASASPAVQFNMSHSGDWGLIAVARVAVGVDVEHIRPRRADARFAQRFLTAGERELLRERAAEQHDAAFFIVWTRKEAYLKAAGFGLAAPFSAVDSATDRLPDLDEHGNQLAGEAPWSIQEFFVDDRHPAAVVARAAQISPRFFTLRRPNS